MSHSSRGSSSKKIDFPHRWHASARPKRRKNDSEKNRVLLASDSQRGGQPRGRRDTGRMRGLLITELGWATLSLILFYHAGPQGGRRFFLLIGGVFKYLAKKFWTQGDGELRKSFDPWNSTPLDAKLWQRGLWKICHV